MATDSKKERKTEKAFFNEAGEETKRPTATSVGFRIKDISEPNGRELRRKVADYKQAVRTCAELFGFSTALGNTIGKKDSDFDDLLARDEVFMTGEWADTAEGGPRISLLAAAIVRAGKSAGADLALDKVTEQLKALDDAGRKSMKDDPAIAVAFAEIQAEQARERAKVAKAKLKETGASSLLAAFMAKPEAA